MAWFLVVFAWFSGLTVARRAVLPTHLWTSGNRRYRMWLGRGICRAFGVRITRRGHPPVRPTMIVANHLSWADAFVFAAELGVRFVVSSTFRVPVMDTVLKAGGNIFIDRKRLRDSAEVGRLMAKSISPSEPMMVFPEATTSIGKEVIAFRAAMLQPLVEAKTPVSYAALRYEVPAGWPPASVVMCWFDYTPLLLIAYRAFHVPWAEAQVVYGEQSLLADDRKTLSRILHKAVSDAFVPMPQLPPEQIAKIEVTAPREKKRPRRPPPPPRKLHPRRTRRPDRPRPRLERKERRGPRRANRPKHPNRQKRAGNPRRRAKGDRTG
jgi:1-acyl-sn-glycerol-3-phosphate acyltransferase